MLPPSTRPLLPAGMWAQRDDWFCEQKTKSMQAA